MAEKIFYPPSKNPIHYLEEGEGNPLLLLHGSAESVSTFGSMITDLAENFHVFAMDFRGHGKSGHCKGAYTLQHYADDVVFFIEQTIKQPTHIFGHSLGGMVACLIAASHPSLVRKLVAGDIPLKLSTMKELVESEKEMIHQILLWMRTQKLGKIKEVLNNDAEAEMLFLCDPDIFSSTVNQFDKTFAIYNTNVIFPKIAAPVLLLRGSSQHGSLVKEEDLQMVLQSYPNWSEIFLPHVGHGLFKQDKNQVVSSIKTFLQEA